MYAKFINEHNLEYAPRTITRNGTHYNPYPVEMMLADGYKPVIDTPYPDDGGYYNFRYIEETDRIVKEWYEVPAPSPDPVEQLRADVDYIAMETGVEL